MKQICIFASAADTENEAYLKAASDLGKLLAEKGYGIVYGAGGTGLMGVCAHAHKMNGGHLTGIIPEFLLGPGVCYTDIDETIVTKTLHDRKKKMEDMALGFVALPGGFGTYEELMEALTLKQLGEHNKPVIVLNAGGYYDGLKAAFENIFANGFAAEKFKTTYYFAPDAQSAVKYLEEYKAEALPKKANFNLKKESGK